MYIFTITVLAILVFCDLFIIKGKNKIYLIIIAFLLIVFHDGLRWEMATDWYPYFRNFTQKASLNEFPEIGYNLFVSITKFVFNSYTFFLVILSAFVYLLYYKSFLLYSPYPILSVFLFYCSYIGKLGMNRQIIAAAICFFSIQYIIKRKFFPFIISIAIATTFHFSAPVFIIAYLFRKDLKVSHIIIFITFAFITSILMSNSIIKLYSVYFLGVDEMSQKINYYINSSNENKTLNYIFGMIKKGVLLFVIYRYKNKLEENSTINTLFNIYLIGTLTYIAFYNSVAVIVARANFYFDATEVILIPLIIVAFKKYTANIFTYILIISYGIFSFNKSISLYPDLFKPYKGVIVNTDTKSKPDY